MSSRFGAAINCKDSHLGSRARVLVGHKGGITSIKTPPGHHVCNCERDERWSLPVGYGFQELAVLNLMPKQLELQVIPEVVRVVSQESGL